MCLKSLIRIIRRKIQDSNMVKTQLGMKIVVIKSCKKLMGGL